MLLFCFHGDSTKIGIIVVDEQKKLNLIIPPFSACRGGWKRQVYAHASQNVPHTPWARSISKSSVTFMVLLFDDSTTVLRSEDERL